MSVIYENCPGATIVEEERYHYVVAYDDLKSLCQTLLYEDAITNDDIRTLSETTLEVNIHHQSNEDLSIEPRSNSVQRRLLEPFTSLHSVLDFTITGQVNTEYANSIIVRAMSPAPRVEETVDRVMSMTPEARNLSDRGHHGQAIDKHKSALIQTFTRSRYLTAENVLQEGLLAGRTESFAFGYLEVMLKSRVAMCHAELDEWEETQFWACDATFTRLFPTKYAEAVYLIAWMVDAESNKAVHILEPLVEKLNDTLQDELYADRDLSALEKNMRSKEEMDCLRDLKAVMKGLAKRDWVKESDNE